jgi:hypothetical protein
MKILSLGKLKNNRIKSISIMKNEFGLCPKSAKELLDKMLNEKFNDFYIEDYNIDILNKLFDIVEFKYDFEDDNIMDLGSSKYGMIQYQDELDEAQKWYDELDEKHKEYVDRLIQNSFPVA